MNRKRKIGCAVFGNALHNHVDHNIRGRNRRKNPAGDPGLIAHIVHRHFRLITIDTDAADNDIFHVRSFFFRECPNVALQA